MFYKDKRKSLLLIFFLLSLIPVAVYAYSVTFRFVGLVNGTKNDDICRLNGTSITGSTDYNDTLSPEKRYISCQDDGAVLSLFFNGEYFDNVTLTTNYSSNTTILMELTQKDDANDLLLVFTQGTYSGIEERINQTSPVFSTTFGGFSHTAPALVKLFLILLYPDIDISTSLVFGSGNYKMSLENTGKNSLGQSIVDMSVVS